jgi:serine/threonine protein kinase
VATKCPKCRSENSDTAKFCSECATPLQSTKDLGVTRTIETSVGEFTRGTLFAGRYEIIEELGKGGMGNVYRVEDKKTKEEIALKFIKSEIASDEKTIDRFHNELTSARKIRHKNVCGMFDLGEHEGTHFITMEYVPGEDLKSFIRRSKRLSIPSTISIARQICDGLGEAHGLGIVHRDLKPQNIMIDKEGNSRIMDFGIARSIETKGITGAGVMIGTPEYMSPEQAEGKDVDQRSDLYSLGIILYEMATNQLPFEGDSPLSTAMKQKGEIPRNPKELNPQIPDRLNHLILKCLEKEKEKRYQNADELLAELERIEEEAPVVKPKISMKTSLTAREITVKFSLKKLLFPGLAATAIIIVLLYLIIFSKSGFFSEEASSGIPRLLNVKALTKLPGLETQPTWSPDGQMVAFAAEVSGSWDIWIKRISGGDAIQITDDPFDNFEPDWSPDGENIVFRSNRKNHGLYVIPAFGGDDIRISDFGYRPRWSPDGRSILFQLREGSLVPNEIYLLEYPVNQPPQKLLSDEKGLAYSGRADWSPDGKHIVFQSRSGGRGIAILPVDSKGKMYFLNVNGQRVDGSGPIWTSNGRGIIFSKTFLMYLPLNNNYDPVQKATQLTTSLSLHQRITRDGMRLAYSSSNTQTDIWKVRLDLATGKPSEPPVRILDHPASDSKPIALPDNKHFLFISDRDNDQFLYLADLDGKNVRLVDNSRSWYYVYSISPDGKWIVIMADQPRRRFLIPFDPVALEAIGPAKEFGRRGINWTPDGKFLMGGGGGDQGTIYAIEDPTSPEPKEISWLLKPDFIQQYPNIGYSYFSPSGNWIAFAAYKDRHKPFIFVVKRGTDTPRLIWEGSGFPMWMADEERIHLISERGDETANKFGFIRFDPEKGIPLGSFEPMELKPTFGYIPVTGYAMTQDRKWLIFSFAETEGDIYVGDLSYEMK